MYASIKKGLAVCLATKKQFPYFPTRYFRCQVANWLVANRQKVMLVKGNYIRQAYGIRDGDVQFPGPFSYREYCRNILDKRFWGDALILYTVFCMWAVKITVVNSRTLQQYKVRHAASLQNADIALVYNFSSHYTAAGKCFHPSFCTSNWSLVIKSWDIYVVTCRCHLTSYSHLKSLAIVNSRLQCTLTGRLYICF